MASTVLSLATVTLHTRLVSSPNSTLLSALDGLLSLTFPSHWDGSGSLAVTNNQNDSPSGLFDGCLLAQRSSNILVHLGDGSLQTTVRAAMLR